MFGMINLYPRVVYGSLPNLAFLPEDTHSLVTVFKTRLIFISEDFLGRFGVIIRLNHTCQRQVGLGSSRTLCIISIWSILFNASTKFNRVRVILIPVARA